MVRRSRRLALGTALSLVVATSMLAVFAGLAFADQATPAPSPSPTPVRELIDQRSEYSQTWLLSDGSWQTTYYASPMFVRDEAGVWQPVNPAFIPAGGAYQTASAPVDVTVANEAAGQVPVTVESDGWSVSLDLVGRAEGGSLVLGDTAIYPDVANATDVTYTATGDALRELITLQSAAAPNSFTYRLSHPGLALAKDAAGEWALFAPGATTPIFVIGPLCVADSSVDGSGLGAFCDGATMTVIPGEGSSTITYMVPRSWLSDPARVWPVQIDPDLFSRNPTDVYLSSATPGTAMGSADPQNLFCGKVTSSNNCRTLIKFPQITDGISAGSHVNSAQLQVRQYSGPSSSYKPHVFYLNAPSSLWGENSTWNNTTLDSTEITSGITAPNGDSSWMYVDCLDIVQKWVDRYPPNKGFQIRQTDAEGTGYGRKFRSGEYSDANYRPSITVNYTDPSIAVTSPGADGPVCQGKADSIGWSFPTQSQHGSFTVQVVSSGGTAYTVASGILANGSASYSCAWNPAQTVGAGWTARVTYYDAQGASVLSSSSSAFEIFAAPLVTSPNGGESWLRGSTQIVTWSVPQSPPNGHFHVLYGTDGGAWYTIANNLPATARSCSWTILMTPGSGWKVCVECDDAGDRLVASDKSDAGFTIADCSPTITAPNGGGTSYIGRTENITWTSPAVSSGHFSVALVSSGGAATIVNDNVAATGASSYSLPWTVGQGESAGYGWKARVTYYNADGTSIGLDSSDAGFAILPDADPAHTLADLGSWDGHAFAGELDTGKLTASVTDLAISSLGPAAEVSRVYRTGDATSRFAPGWFFSFEQKLDLAHTSDSLNRLTYADEESIRHDFYRADASSPWQAPNGFFATLTQSGSSWKLAFDDQRVLTFDSSGRLVREARNAEDDQDGTSLVAYDWVTVPGQLTISAANGQQIVVALNGSGNVTGATYSPPGAGTRTVAYSGSGTQWTVTYNAADPGANGTARTVTYSYDGSGRLTTVSQANCPPSGAAAGVTAVYGTGGLTDLRWPTYDAQSAPDAHVSIGYAGASATVSHYGSVTDGSGSTQANQPMQVTTYRWLTSTSGPCSPGLETSETDLSGAPTTTDFSYASDQQLSSTSTLPGTDPSPSPSATPLAAGSAAVDTSDSGNSSHQVTSDTTATQTSSGSPTISDGQYASYTYDAQHRMASETTYVTYNASAPESSVPLGRTLYSYDAYGNCTETVVQHWKAQDSTWVTDTDATYSYNAQGQLTGEKKVSEGTTLSETQYSNFAPCGQPQTTVAKSVQLSVGGASGDLTKTVTYDAFGNLLTESDWGGRTTATNTYDLAGRELTSADAAGVTTHNSYDSLGDLTVSYKTAPGTSMKADWTETTCDAMGRATAVVSKTSDANGSGTAVRTVTNAYDGSGHQLTSTDSTVGGQPEKWTYNADGEVLSHWAMGVNCYTSGAGANDPRATRYAYDAQSRQTGESTPGNAVAAGAAGSATTSYDAAGQVTSKVNADGSSIGCTYDDAGNQTAVASSASGTTTSSFGADGLLASTTSADGFTTTPSYDAQGRTVREQGSYSGQSPAQASTTTTYNSLDWVLQTVDANGVTDSKTYYADGSMHFETVGTQGQASCAYYSDGRLHTKTDPNGNTVTYTYDAFGNVTEEKHTDWNSSTLKDVLTSYDSLGRPTSESVVGVTHTWSYPQNSATGVQETVAYDATPLTSTTVNRNSRNMEYNRVTTIASGTTVTRATLDDGTARDAADRWTSATVQLSGFSALTFGRTFDNAGRIATQTGAGLSAAGSYGYDASSGLETSQTLSLSITAGSAFDNYTYANDGRLRTWSVRTSATATPTPMATYIFDPAGNLSSDGTTTFAYDAASCHLTSSTSVGVTTQYGWDNANGWRTSQGPTGNPSQITYSYVKPSATPSTSNGRMSAYSNSATSTSATYAYDASGQRTRNTVIISGTTTTTNFTYDGLTLLKLSAAQGSSSWRIDYLYDEEGAVYGGVYRSPASSTTPTHFTAITNDHGDVLELLDANGAAFVSYRYDPWGKPIASGTSSAATSLINSTLAADIASRQVLRYASYAYDAESSLYYCSARYYDSATRQWTTGDPAKADGEESAYQYCGGNPPARDDSSGTKPNPHKLKPITFNIPTYYTDVTSYFMTVLRTDAGATGMMNPSLIKLYSTPHHAWDFKRTVPKAYWNTTLFKWRSTLKAMTVDINVNGHHYSEQYGGTEWISADDFGNMHFGVICHCLYGSYGHPSLQETLQISLKAANAGTEAKRRDEARDEAMITEGWKLMPAAITNGRYYRIPATDM